MSLNQSSLMVYSDIIKTKLIVGKVYTNTATMIVFSKSSFELAVPKELHKGKLLFLCKNTFFNNSYIETKFLFGDDVVYAFFPIKRKNKLENNIANLERIS